MKFSQHLHFTQYNSVPAIRGQFTKLLSSNCFSPGKLLQFWYTCNPLSICVKTLWVVTDKEIPVAMALARSAEPNFVVFVKPTYRRQGIGTRLVELCNSGVLTLRTKNPEAVAFARSVSKLDDLRVEVFPRRYCEYDLRGEQEDQGSAK